MKRVSSACQLVQPIQHQPLQVCRVGDAVLFGQRRGQLAIEVDDGPRRRQHGRPLQRDVGRPQRSQCFIRQRLVQLEVRIVVHFLVGEVMVQTGQVHANAPQNLQLAGCPPQLAAAERCDEVRQVMPEPHDLPAQRLTLLDRLRNRVSAGNPVSKVLKDAGLVHQRPPRAVRLGEVAGPVDGQLPLRPVGQDEEQDAGEVEVLDEQRLAQLPYERLAPGDEVVVGVVGNDHAEVEVGPCVGRAAGVGAEEDGGEDVGIGLAGGDEAIENR